jgi:hypothetical protein
LQENLPRMMSVMKVLSHRLCPKRLMSRTSNVASCLLNRHKKHAPDMPDCQDLSQAHQVVADGLWFDDSVPLINHNNVII